MKNLAGVLGCESTIKDELAYAGITCHYIDPGRSEVPSHICGRLCGWTFTRAWYYWRATGPALPFKYAAPLHELIGKEVRVGGHAGCPSPEKWYGKTGPIPNIIGVPSYHIDTQEGLTIFAATLKKWSRDD